MDLKSILRNTDDVPSAKIEYTDGFKVEMRFITRSAFTALAEKNRRMEWDSESHKRVETVDSEKVNREFVKKYVIGWEGLTPEKLVEMVPIDPDTDFSEIEEIPFSFDNAFLLMTENADFEAFVVNNAVDVGNFQSVIKEELRGN